MAALMKNVYGEGKLSKNAGKQFHRKHQKAILRLKQREGISTVDEPTQFLFVANGGLGNGVSRSDLEKLFTPHGDIMDINMHRSKPHSFIHFSSSQSALRAHIELNGKILQCPDEVCIEGVQIFTAFVQTVPGQVDPCDFGCLPPGLIVLEDVINLKYENELIESNSWDDDTPDAAGSSSKHRQVKHYGYEFVYGLNNVRPDEPLIHGIPDVCNRFLAKLEEDGYVSERADQLTVNRYLPGQGIPPHVDTHSAFTDTIVSLSVGSSCVMDFKHPDGRHYPVMLPRRSAVIMSGESRYVWTHGITSRKSDLVPCEGGTTLAYRDTRVSFTFRRLRRKACDCNYPAQCDSQNQSQVENERVVMPRNELDAIRLEDEHVHKVYDDIADHFSDTRHSPWPKVAEFLHSLPDHSLVMDVGCGNGKYLGVNGRLRMIGNDRSANLVEVCSERGHEAFVCDLMSLPLRDGVCDACICIAVIHHLSTEVRRLHSVRELIRLLRPGGLCLIYVWAMEQELHKVKSNYLKNSKLKQKTESMDTSSEVLPVHVNRTHFERQDVLVPWHLNKNSSSDVPVFHRFYHVFHEGELEQLCLTIENVQIVKGYYDKGNWCVIIRKKE